MAKMLRNGEGDIAACNLKYDQEQSKLIQLTQPYVFTKHVLVKLKNKGKFDLCDLESDEIVVRKGSFSAIASEEFASNNELELNLQFAQNDIENYRISKVSNQMTPPEASRNSMWQSSSFSPAQKAPFEPSLVVAMALMMS